MTTRSRLPSGVLGRHCLIIGGAGYIGSRFVRRALAQSLFSRITIADIRDPVRFMVGKKIAFERCDVRRPLDDQIEAKGVDWILNVAAVHREPGHEVAEFFETNVSGADNVCRFAEARAIKKMLFTSSIAVYGSTRGPTDETALCSPDSPYGSSKLAAEHIYRGWAACKPNRRLIVVRPGVVYGPGETGNMTRLVHALQLGIFLYPGDDNIRKSYAYIDGLLDSFEFSMLQSDTQIIYNYVEKETLPLRDLVSAIQKAVGTEMMVRRIPGPLLEIIAHCIQLLSGGRSSIHPQRVKKAGRPTHIIPKVLMERGFEFNYDFATSLRAWLDSSPQDFLAESVNLARLLQMRAAGAISVFL